MTWPGTIEVIGKVLSNFVILFAYFVQIFPRFINGSTKWDDYRFYHWSGIDFFCYFSHEYVTIPTLSWINVAHKHGVKVLGTVIFENMAGRTILEEILQSAETLKSVVDSLVLIAKRCNFEGWLLNVECDLKPNKIPLLRDFVEYLTLQMHENVHHGVVIWYDSIIESGQLVWQNELNTKNKLFFDACDGILINYAWNELSLKRTEEIVNGMPEAMSKIYFGIDVFGRGQKAKFETAVVSTYNYFVSFVNMARVKMLFRLFLDFTKHNETLFLGGYICAGLDLRDVR